LLASMGFEAHERILEARHGLAEVWWTDKADLSAITAGLGEEYSILGTAFKYYSAGYPIHAPLYGSLQILKENSLSPDDVAKVRVGMSSQAAEIVDSRDMPSICLQDMLSLGMVLGRMRYEDAHDVAALERDDV